MSADIDIYKCKVCGYEETWAGTFECPDCGGELELIRGNVEENGDE